VGRTDAEFNLNSEVMDPINLTAEATCVVAGQSSDPHAAAAVVWVYFLTVCRTPLFVSDGYWIAEAQAAVFTGSSNHPRTTLCSDAEVWKDKLS